MRYCKKCVQPDTRPGIYFDERGICGACLYEEEKKNINWDSREQELREIVKWAKKNSKSAYDCVIGVSGGKDSTFQSLYSRDILGLHPLLVNSEPEDITEIGRHNIENLKQLGFDVISLRPNPRLMQKLVKKDFYRYLNPVKVTEYSLWSSAYIVAAAFRIPLIIQGENPGLTLGVRHKTGSDGDCLNADKQDTLEKDCISEYSGDGVSEQELFMFHYNKNSLRQQGIRGIWLQYYVKEWSQPGNAAFSISYGLRIRPPEVDLNDLGTYRRYSQLDGNLLELNQLLKYIKFGFGQATDHACYDIRGGYITREQGIALIKQFDGKCGEPHIKYFCDYIGISTDEFWQVADKFRGKMFERDENGKWILKDPIWQQEDFNSDVDVNEVVKSLDSSLEKEIQKRKRWFETLKSQAKEK